MRGWKCIIYYRVVVLYCRWFSKLIKCGLQYSVEQFIPPFRMRMLGTTAISINLSLWYLRSSHNSSMKTVSTWMLRPRESRISSFPILKVMGTRHSHGAEAEQQSHVQNIKTVCPWNLISYVWSAIADTKMFMRWISVHKWFQQVLGICLLYYYN